MYGDLLGGEESDDEEVDSQKSMALGRKRERLRFGGGGGEEHGVEETREVDGDSVESSLDEESLLPRIGDDAVAAVSLPGGGFCCSSPHISS